ncbi:MAG: glycosyltransferase family 4 protein [Deltaproteobacteria bacterium]|nr:glycosyltransferase family 4 protein [Deltaproteobacteria bacterium]
MRLFITYNTSNVPAVSITSLLVTLEALREWATSGKIILHLFRYTHVELSTYRSDVIPRPFFVKLVLRLLSRGESIVKDDLGHTEQITLLSLTICFLNFLKDAWRKRGALKDILNHVSRLEKSSIKPSTAMNINLAASPVYLRTDLLFGISSGGSIGHISGVLNNLNNFTGNPIFLTTDAIPTVRHDIETRYLQPNQHFWDFAELPPLLVNRTFEKQANTLLADNKPAFVYQRYCWNNYTGLTLAQRFHVPFILEYNGSEIWVARHWSKPLKYEALAERIELLNLRAADVIVVVSEPLRVELVGRGIDRNRILVNPNGVDSERYKPEMDGSVVRNKFALNGKTVIGFIGTFGRWHGAEVLAEAFGRLLKEYPVYRDSVRLLMIGDGMTMPQVKENLAKYNVNDSCILTGRIPQEEGPAHLAACDILASPHVPNPDGTPFFGSPTKLFEYMAMGKGIVASDLDQIGEILKHDKTAWMVKPGDAQSLMLGLKKLIDDAALREQLGQSARRDVVANYTWEKHTRKIIEKLKQVTGSA